MLQWYLSLARTNKKKQDSKSQDFKTFYLYNQIQYKMITMLQYLAVINQIMNDLRLLQQVDPNKKVISLEFKQINALEPLLPLLVKFQNLQSLSLHGNRLKNLPKDMSGLAQLAELDISNNLFLDMNDLAQSLKTLPSLTHLIMNFKSHQQQNFIKNSLPRLQRMNKKPLTSHQTSFNYSQQKKKYSIQKLNEQDLQSIGLLYDEIREIYRNSKYFVDKELADDFDRNVENIMSELDHKLKGNQNGIEKNCNIICGKYALIDLCFVKLITYFYHFDKKIAHAFERIHDEQANMFKSITDLVFTEALRLKIEIQQVKTQKQQLYKNQIRRLKMYQAQASRQIQYLENKNKEFIEKLMKYGKANIFQNVVSQAFQASPYSRSPTKQANRLDLSREKDVMVSIKNKPKSLSLNQLKEIMSEIYQSKQKFNTFCIENRQPLETLETHMYTYLNQKYGLKSIAIQWVMSIVNGIKKYGMDDPEVAIFGKILRNQVEEQFLLNLRKIKENFVESYRKFKKNLTQGECSEISIMESQQILLFMHMRREEINVIVQKLKDGGMINNLIPIDKLEKSLLDYYVKRHDEKIFQLQKQFKVVDSDEDGIINIEQLQALMKMIYPNVDMEKLIQLLDPSKRGIFIFSYLCEKFLTHPDLKDFLKSPQ